MMRKLIPAITLFFTATFLLMMALSLRQGGPYILGTELISVILMGVPILLAWKEVIELPWAVVLGAGVALSIHSFGLVTKLYDTTSWFSHLAHFASGIEVASLVAIVLIIVIHQDSGLQVPVRWVPYFVLIAVLSLEGFWKIFEFTLDHSLGTTMGHGLEDLMNDNISDTVAGIFAGLGVAYLIRHRSVDKIVENLKVQKSVALLTQFFSK